MINQINSVLVLISFVALFSIASFAQKAPLVLEKGVESHARIDAIYAKFSESYKTLNPELVASLYTKDAAYLSPGSEITKGRDAILANFTRSFERSKKEGRNLTISFNIIQRKVEKNLGYDVGVYTLNYYKDGKMLSEHKGKFVVVAVKGKDGKWRFQVDGYSNINPPKDN